MKEGGKLESGMLTGQMSKEERRNLKFIFTSAATAKTALKSASPVASGGVPTAIKIICDDLNESVKEVENNNLPASVFRFIRSSNPGS